MKNLTPSELYGLKTSSNSGFRIWAAMMYSIGCAVAIEHMPLGHVDAHRWPYSPYRMCSKCYSKRNSGHKMCDNYPNCG